MGSLQGLWTREQQGFEALSRKAQGVPEEWSCGMRTAFFRTTQEILSVGGRKREPSG